MKSSSSHGRQVAVASFLAETDDERDDENGDDNDEHGPTDHLGLGARAVRRFLVGSAHLLERAVHVLFRGFCIFCDFNYRTEKNSTRKPTATDNRAMILFFPKEGKSSYQRLLLGPAQVHRSL